MKRIISQTILLSLFIVFLGQEVYASKIEIQGTIGGTEETSVSQELKKSELDESNEFAQPKQREIQLKKFPNTGSTDNKLIFWGWMLLLSVFLISYWNVYQKK